MSYSSGPCWSSDGVGVGVGVGVGDSFSATYDVLEGVFVGVGVGVFVGVFVGVGVGLHWLPHCDCCVTVGNCTNWFWKVIVPGLAHIVYDVPAATEMVVDVPLHSVYVISLGSSDTVIKYW